MFLSIIVPVYNARAYLPACLDSALAQDIPREAYEIVCVDDGSTDGSAGILADYAARHPQIRVLRQENSGVAAARNAGLEAAQGEYIWFVDADDMVRPHALSLVREKIAETGCDRLTVGGYQFEETLSPQEQALARQGTLPVNAPWYDAVVWRNVLRRRFLRQRGLCFRYPELTHGEDGLFLYELLQEGPASADLPEVLYFYRQHPGSAETAGSQKNRERKLRSYIRIAQILRDYYQSGRTDPATADKLMSFLWFALYEAAALPAGKARAALGELHRLGLFPYRRPAACTLTRAYMTGRSGWAGRILDGLCRRLHTPWGFGVMWLLQRLRSAG